MSILLFRSSNILHQLKKKKKTIKKNRCCMVCWLPCSSGFYCGYSVENQNDKLKFMVLHRCSYFNQITVQIIKTNYFLSPTMCHKFINILN